MALTIEDYDRINSQRENTKGMRATLENIPRRLEQAENFKNANSFTQRMEAEIPGRQASQQQAFAKANMPSAPMQPKPNVLAKLKTAGKTVAKSAFGKAALPIAAGVSAVGSFNTPTEDYAARLGINPADAGVGTRALGVLQDLGNTLTFGAADRVGNLIAGNGFNRSPQLDPMRETLNGAPANPAPSVAEPEPEIINRTGLSTPVQPAAQSGGMPVAPNQPDFNQESVNLLRSTLAQAQGLQDPMKAQTNIELPQNANIFQTLMAMTGAQAAAGAVKSNNDMIKTNMGVTQDAAGAMQDAARQDESQKDGVLARENTQIGLDNLKSLRKTFDEYGALNDENDKDGSKREQLAEQALLLQGKEPKERFEFKLIETGEADSLGQPVKRLARVNNKTGAIEMIDQKSMQQKNGASQYEEGKFYQTPQGVLKFVGLDTDGQPLWDDGK